jgi:methyl-accepting chemotaxis protein
VLNRELPHRPTEAVESTGAVVHARRSISTRLAISLSAMATGVFMLGTWLAYLRTEGPFTDRFVQDLSSRTKLIREVVAQFDNSGRHAAKQLMGTFEALFPGGVALDPGKTANIGDEDVPVLQAAGTSLHRNLDQVDAFTRTTGGSVATIFVRKGDALIRVATSLKKEDGSRAMGTRLDPKSPSHAALMEGRTYLGKARLFGRDYMTEYKPLLGDGKLIGALFIGFEITDPMTELKKLIRDIRIAKTGYVFVFDSKGNAEIHPAKEGKNIIDTKDSSGRYVIREIVEKKRGVLEYPWINKELGETSPRNKISTLDYYEPWDWVIGTSSYTDELYAELRGLRNTLIAIGFLGVIVISLITYALVRRGLAPVASVAGVMHRIGQGDASQDVDEAIRARMDELGVLGRATQTMSESLRGLLRDIGRGVKTLTAASGQLSSVSTQTSRGVADVSDRTNKVAGTAEQASTNTHSVASSMEDATSNLLTVSSATTQMSATVGEIAANSEKARAVSEQAHAQAQSVTAQMQRLGEAARDIGKVTDTITSISAQTNLLALNATIEAARAGAAGKGFAVVAGEIKELAQQTAQATEDIKAKIASVQTTAGGAIADIEGISGIIGEVQSLVSSIAAAIEEQSSVTRDVAENIARASAGVQGANDGVSQTATASGAIAQEIAGLGSAIANIRAGGEQVERNASELLALSHELAKLLERFKA